MSREPFEAMHGIMYNKGPVDKSKNSIGVWLK